MRNMADKELYHHVENDPDFKGLRVNEGTNSEGARLLLEKRGVAFDDGTGVGLSAPDVGRALRSAQGRQAFHLRRLVDQTVHQARPRQPE